MSRTHGLGLHLCGIWFTMGHILYASGVGLLNEKKHC